MMQRLAQLGRHWLAVVKWALLIALILLNLDGYLHPADALNTAASFLVGLGFGVVLAIEAARRRRWRAR